LTSNQYFQLGRANVFPHDNAFHNRAVLINEEFWNIVRSEVLFLNGESGALLLYQLGQSIGFRLGAQQKDIKDVDTVDALGAAFDYSLAAGWGRIEIEEIEFSNGRLDWAEVKVYDNFFVRGRANTHKPSCFFVSGMLAGIVEGLLDEGHNCIETSCSACGSPFCLFRISRIDPN
jgi:uncharacterized protein